MKYTSEIAVKGLGIAPIGSPHNAPDCICSMCNRPILQGNLSKKKELPRTFFDFPHLALSDYICGYCAATTDGQAVMRNLQRCVITEQGIYNLNTDDARAWFWLTPPPPPFAVVINHNTLGAFHYFWRTPATLDAKLVKLNVDGVVYEVRRSRVLKALEYGKVILERAAKEPGRKALKAPFMVLSRDPTSKAREANGRIASEVRKLLAKAPELQEAVDFLDTLNPGELIAISPFLKQKPATPTQPELLKE